MSLKKCISKAGKDLDNEDKIYLLKMLKNGTTDKDALKALKQKLLKEQSELISILKEQNINVKTESEAVTEIKSEEITAKPTTESKVEKITTKPETESTVEDKAKYTSDKTKHYSEYYIDKTSPVDKATVRYLNYAVATMLNSKMEKKGIQIAGRIHNKLKEVFPMYLDASNKLTEIYDESESLSQFVHTVTGKGINKILKADILSVFQKITSEHQDTINTQLAAFHHAMKGLSEEQKTIYGKFVTKLPLHDYFLLADDKSTGVEIDAEVELLEDKLDKKIVADVQDLVNWNIKGKITGDIYNLDARYEVDGSEFKEDIRKLLALKSIQAIGTKEFEEFLSNTDLVNLIKDHTVANRLTTIANEGTEKLTDSLVMDYYKDTPQTKAITVDQLKLYEYGENNGWKLLITPTKDRLGVVYNHNIDSTSIPGAFTDIKLSSTDIDVDESMSGYRGVVKTRTGYKLLIPYNKKIEMGLVEDFSQALVRSTAHSIAIKDTEIIRNTLLREETRYVMNGKDDVGLMDMIEADNVDNPWFVKLGKDIAYDSLDSKIKAKYKPVEGRASNVKGFNREVDLVRKDISHWLLGGSSKSLFQNPKMRWTMRIVKDLIAGSKIGMVVTNPLKIASDNVSNISYLGVMGASPIFIAKNYRDISRDFADYQEIQNKITQLRVQITARPDSENLKKQLKTLQDRAKKNPVGDLGKKGFINSLGSDLVSKNADTLSGLQADMHTGLEYLLTNNKGGKNYLSHFISRLHKLGFEGEDFLGYVGGIVGRFKDGKVMEDELNSVQDRLKEIRSDDDIINYVSQYTTSPSSELVRVGSSMTDLTDVLAKETLYRHLTENEGVSPQAARIIVLDSFPDYKENMPLAIKELSDLGIIMFPSFWLRIQKVIYRMAKDKPITLATEQGMEYALQEAYEVDGINNIFDANIINKATTFTGILHTPLDSAGIGSGIPMHLW